MSRTNRTNLKLEQLEDRCVPATFTVRNLNDSGPGSLRDAIATANDRAGADVIVFRENLHGTITLNGSLAITDSLSIKGGGAEKLVISGDEVDRVFTIDEGNDGNFLGVKISRLTVTDGGNVAQGGAINNRENLTLSGVKVLENSTNVGGTGGGIYAPLGNLTLRNCTISGNGAGGSGGGVFFAGGTLAVENCTFTSNRSLTGAGLYTAARNEANLSNSRFAGNHAISFGGAIQADFSSIKVQGCTITDNGSLGPAGGIAVVGGTLIADTCTISGNAGNSGGGIYVNLASADISRSTISHNTSFAAGGGIYMNLGSTVNVSNSTLSGNRASGNGGGIANPDSVLTVSNSTIAFNVAWSAGGGIWSGMPATLRSSIVGRNLATDAPDLFSDKAAAVFTLHNCLIGNTYGANYTEVGTNQLNQDPLLAPLASNGGPTQTHALLAGSPAIDHGVNPDNLLTDQRGGKFKRVKGPAIDIGAFEL